MKKLILGVILGFVGVGLMGCSNGGDAASSAESSAPKEEEITLYLTRHGKTMLNTMDISQGWVDSPLTPEGIEVAEKLGEGLKEQKITFDSVYSSDAGRARETAKLILEHSGQELPINEDARFREANFGSYEAKPNMEMAAAAAEEAGITLDELLEMLQTDTIGSIRLLSDALHDIDAKKDASEMGWPAESSKEVINRLVAGTDDIIKVAQKNGEKDILVVFHGNSIIKLLYALDPTSNPTMIENASISKVIYKDGKYTVESVNDTSYIKE